MEPTGEDVVPAAQAVACKGTRRCRTPARHRCPHCRRPLCSNHAKRREGKRVCHRCRLVFAAPAPPSPPSGEPVAQGACGAVHFEALFPDRIHRCDLPHGHDDPTKHSQWHARAGACGAPYCAGSGWRDRSDQVDPITPAVDRICQTLDDIYATLTCGDGTPRASEESRQLSLFPSTSA